MFWGSDPEELALTCILPNYAFSVHLQHSNILYLPIKKIYPQEDWTEWWSECVLMTKVIWGLRGFISSINFFMKQQQLIFSHMVWMFVAIYVNTIKKELTT